MHLIYNVFFLIFTEQGNILKSTNYIYFVTYFSILDFHVYFKRKTMNRTSVLYCLFLALLCNFEVIYVYAALWLRWIQLWKLAYNFFYDWAINETECFEKYKWIKEEIKCIYTYTSWNSANKIPHYELISKFYLHVPTLTINQFVIWKHFS